MVSAVLSPIRVLIVDDHAAVRRGIHLALRVYDDLSFAGEAANGAEAVAICNQLTPDVILMDLMMPEMDGITATGIIHRLHPAVRIVGLTSLKDDSLTSRILCAGAVSCILKNASMDELAAAIRLAARSV